MRQLFLALAAVLLGGALPAHAQLGAVPFIFQDGQTASAGDVNTNFDTAYDNALNRLGGVMGGTLTFTPDNTYDIGAAGATRARDFHLARNALIGGTLGVTGVATFGTAIVTTLTCTGCVDAAQLAATAATPGAYGSTTAIPTFTVDADGRLTAAGTTATSALTGIAEAGITDGTILGRLAANETVTGTWSFPNGLGAIVMNDVFTVDNGGSNSAPKLTFAGDTNTGIWSQGSGDITFTNNGLETFRVAESGGAGLVYFQNATVATNVVPTTHNSFSLGTTSLRWADGWFTTVTGTNAYVQSSDARLKHDIQPLTLGLDFINVLRPKEFRLIEGPQDLHYGFTAQDLIAVDFQGVDTSNSESYGVRYTDLIAPLVKAVQELAARVDALEAR